MGLSVAEKALAEKVSVLECKVAVLERELDRTRRATLDAMLGPLRLRQIILLHIGKEDPDTLLETIPKEFGSLEASQVLRHLFILNNAPCTDDMREQFRAIFNNGMCRF